MNYPVISVIIPVFEVERYLAECLRSVLKQTIIDQIEVLCINDASPDGSKEILEQYANKHSCIHIYNHIKNSGLSASRNTGLKAAKGKHVFFLDSDDILFSADSLLRLYEMAPKDDADEVIGATLRWEEETGEQTFGYHKGYLKRQLNGVSLREVPYLVSNVIGCNKLIKTSFLRRHGLQFSPKLKKFEDTTFSWKIHFLAHSISLCKKATYLHRIRDTRGPGSIMQKKDKDYFYHSEAALDFLDFIEKDIAYNDTRHIVDKFFLLWLKRDLVEQMGVHVDNEKIIKILSLYNKVLTRIPKSSLKYFNSNDIKLFKLMQIQQYDEVLEQIESLESLNHETIQSRQQCSKEAETVRKLRKRINDIRNSTSWKITAPLRIISKQFQKYK